MQIGELRRDRQTGDPAGAPAILNSEIRAADTNVLVIGAGPYGLAAAAHLRRAGIESHVLGRPMEFWRFNMPRGMLLRSPWRACHISDPDGAYSLDAYARSSGVNRAGPVPLEDFVRYGQWFQQQVVPGLDQRRVVRLDGDRHGFSAELEDGAILRARRVAVAAGLASQPYCPPQFRGLSPDLVSHISEHPDLRQFAGRRVVVIGCGQSAIESAVLLSEAGACTELIARTPGIRWLGEDPGAGRGVLGKLLGRAIRVLSPRAPLGPFPLSWIVELPGIFRRLSPELRRITAKVAVRPAGACWLLPRLGGVTLRTGRVVFDADPEGDGIRLRLDNRSEVFAEHVILATGYRVDVARYDFLSPDLVSAVRCASGQPLLSPGFESSVPGLHFLGAPAAATFGPLMKFIGGTGYAARSLAARVAAGGAR